MEDNVIEGGGLYSYSYDYYRDGELQFETDTTSLSTAVNIYTCSLSMEGDEVRSQASNALYSYNGSSTDTMTIELVDVTIDSVNDNELGYSFYGAIFAYAFYGTTDMYIENTSITNVMSNHGVEMYNGNLEATGVVTMVDSVIDTVDESGVYLYGSGAFADLQNTSISNTTESGLYAYSSAGLTLSNVSISGSGLDNIQLDTSATLVVDDAAPSTSTLSSEYGLYCGDGVEVTNCGSLDLTGNTLGTQTGCDAYCDAE
jgi:hypothetical protein